MSDSGLITLLRGENEFDTSKMVVSKMLVDKLGTPHLKHSQLTLLSPLYTQSGIPMQSWWYHASQESKQTPGVDHFTALRQIAPRKFDRGWAWVRFRCIRLGK